MSQMPTRNISLTAEQDAFVEKLVTAGEYQNAGKPFATHCAHWSSAGGKTISS
jgi:hypothetical protein